jgi:lysophospholipase L1-like esterase
MSKRPTRALRSLVIAAAMSLAVPLALGEAATRALTRVLPQNGMPAFLGIPLLPFRPAFEAVVAWSEEAEEAEYVGPDAALGWSIVPNGRALDGRYEANAQGARAPRDVVYAATPPPGKRRVVTVGDSFTHGDGVAGPDTWQRRLEGERADLEVVNFGVPGFGTDQAVLRWRRDAAPLRADVALLGIWPENLCRNLNVIRYFLQPASGFSQKPRFTADANGLTVIGQPVLTGEALARAVTEPAATPLVAHDLWADPRDVEPAAWQASRLARVVATLWRTRERKALRERLYGGDDPRGIELTVAIARAWAGEVAATGVAPRVVLIPMVELLETYPDEDSFPLVRALRAAGVETIDLGPPMTREVRARGAACCFQDDGHLSPEGNALVARWLAERLAPLLARDGAS